MKSESENIEEMDDLIRNSSEHEVYSIQDGDWEQLQMMMNADDRRKNIGWLWTDIIVLIITGACFLFANNDSSVNKRMEQAINVPASQIDRKNELEKKANSDIKANYQEDLIDITSENTETMIPVLEQAYPYSNKVKQTEDLAKSIKESKQELPIANEHASIIRIEDNHQLKSITDTKGNLSLLEESTLIKVNAEENKVIEHEVPEVAHPDTVSLAPIITEIESELFIENPDTVPLAVSSLDSNTITEKTTNRKMHIYFGIGTEWSVTSKMPVGPTKLKLQLGGEYQFLKKWSVLSGVNYTVKDYQTNAEDYTVKPGFWTNGIKPSSISAKCNVLEIPLNIRYYFNAQNSSRNSFFLTAGASSYLMATERYDFVYDIDDPTLKQGWNGKWENIHYFSALHFSAGYQKSLHRNCSVLMEPYVDLPLNGIGFGQIDLVSFGLSLQFKY